MLNRVMICTFWHCSNTRYAATGAVPVTAPAPTAAAVTVATGVATPAVLTAVMFLSKKL